MKNDLKQEQNGGILNIIKNFFSKIFGKNKQQALPEADNIAKANSNTTKNAEINNTEKTKTEIQIMQEEYNKSQEKETLLKQIENNPDLINNWPIEKLKKLEELYDEKIAQLGSEIARLKVGYM